MACKQRGLIRSSNAVLIDSVQNAKVVVPGHAYFSVRVLNVLQLLHLCALIMLRVVLTKLV